ncbi:PqqD family protein of HPr-rel-A system [Sphingobium fontiphilum]|uniref:PqqD family protein of HPr-rel-A system n=1 Tax=Sphingobium fontiphilum TaxID=944425 RepID=A0A7W6GNJ3_9SPHN|nr:HPr-rel-A system PqqD family peptide chaperone [Sphingobium fontiphilum]MBB3981875.1 PqqD family protein of HPr-rel-A system [Sphingobium fontiphilum]
MNGHYRAEPETALVVRPLDDIVLLYHRPSGQTHMVVSPVPEILEALCAGGDGDAAAVHDWLAQTHDLGPREQAISAIAAHLADMAAIGLVRAL